MADIASRALILGGTGEARRLALRACEAGLDIELSLAGRTREAADTGVPTRVGGFGGADGLAAYLRANRIARVLDATHPFAARISANAVAACALAGVPRLALLRDEWRMQAGDLWRYADDVAHAARLLPDLGKRVFVAFGDGLGPLAATGLDFVVRRIEADPVDLPGAEIVRARGPFREDDERRLFADKRIDAILAKDSGGTGARAKLDAARDLRLPVVLIRRPSPPPGPATTDAAAALAWLGLDATAVASL